MVKFIIQLHHATQRRTTQHRREVDSPIGMYQLISHAKLPVDRGPVAKLQQMFEVTVIRFHSATQTCAPMDQQYRRSLSLKSKFTWKRRLLPCNGVRCPST